MDLALNHLGKDPWDPRFRAWCTKQTRQCQIPMQICAEQRGPLSNTIPKSQQTKYVNDQVKKWDIWSIWKQQEQKTDCFMYSTHCCKLKLQVSLRRHEPDLDIQFASQKPKLVSLDQSFCASFVVGFLVENGVSFTVCSPLGRFCLIKSNHSLTCLRYMFSLIQRAFLWQWLTGHCT